MTKTLLTSLFIISALFGFTQQQSGITAPTNIVVLKPSGNLGKDANVWNNNANGNYGNRIDLSAYTWTNSGALGVKRFFIEFDLSGLPANIIVDSSFLKLYYDSTNTINFRTHSGINEMEVKKVNASWNENTLTWNNQPSTSQVNMVNVPAFSNNTQNYSIEVTHLLNDMISTTNHGFMLKMQNELNYYRASIFASSDHPDSTIHPELIIKYHFPTGLESMQHSISDELKVFPNPSKGVLNFDFQNNQKLEDFEIEITNIAGKRINILHSNSQLDLSSLEKGIYFIRLMNQSKENYLKKIILF